MSHRPGYTLEAYVAWQYDLTVLDDAQNLLSDSWQATYAGQLICSETQFKGLIAVVEAQRERIEYLLSEFDEEQQGWRSYHSSGAFDNAWSDEIHDRGLAVINIWPNQERTKGTFV